MRIVVPVPICGERSRPTHVVAQGDVVAAIDGQHSVVDDCSTSELSAGPAGADLQRARGDRRPAFVGIGASENGRAGPDLRQRARAADERHRA